MKIRKHTFIKTLKSARLTPAEKADIRNILLSLIKEHPTKLELGRIQGKGMLPRGFWEVILKPTYASFFVAVLAVLSGAGISYAAEGSLPGSILYSVKVHINENIRSAVAITPESRMEWHIERAERRLEEIEKLTLSGKLNSQTSAEVSKNFTRDIAKASDIIREAEKEGRVEVAAEGISNLEAALQAHKKIIQKAAVMPAKKSAPPKNILNKVEEKKSEASKRRKEIEENISTMVEPRLEISAKKRKEAAENKILEVKSFVEKWEKKLGAETSADAKIRLESASSALQEGGAKLEVKNYADAFVSFQKAHRTAQEAKLLLKAKKELDIGIANGKKSLRNKADKEVEIKIENERENFSKDSEEKDKSDNKKEEKKQKDNSENNGTRL